MLRSTIHTCTLLLLLFAFGSCSLRGPSTKFSSFGHRRGGEILVSVKGDSLQGGLTSQSLIDTQYSTDDGGKVAKNGSLLWLIPLFSSVLAFISFKSVAHVFHGLVEALSNNAWSPQTEAELNLQTEVVTQVVNGPVITSISVLFATLVSTTISFLHARQGELKNLLVTQVDALRNLNILLKELPESVQQNAEQIVHRYSEYLLFDESDNDNNTNIFLHDLLLLLHSQMSFRRSSPSVAMAFECVSRIQQAESNRLTVLETSFPMMHYITLAILAAAICISFLVATDTSKVIFESLQVRILWTILVGAFSALAVVCYDLSFPYLGAYSVSSLGRKR